PGVDHPRLGTLALDDPLDRLRLDLRGAAHADRDVRPAVPTPACDHPIRVEADVAEDSVDCHFGSALIAYRRIHAFHAPSVIGGLVSRRTGSRTIAYTSSNCDGRSTATTSTGSGDSRSPYRERVSAPVKTARCITIRNFRPM